MTRIPGFRLSLALTVVAGCAYYNGLYNANRLAHDARKALRAGRPAEARVLWLQAAVRAESVAIRHPNSRYRDDALLLQGTALRAVDDCASAVAPFAAVADSGQDPRLRDHARLGLAQCRLSLEQPEAAWVLLDGVAHGPDGALALEAKWWRARAALKLGRPDDALADLAAIHDPRAAFDRAAALASAGRSGQTSDALRPVMPPAAYDEAAWTETLDVIGAAAPDDASRLVDSLVAGRGLSDGQRARVLLADGERWAGRLDDRRVMARFDAVVALVPDSSEGREADVLRILLRLARAESVDQLPALKDALEGAARDGGPAATLAGPSLSVLRDLGPPATSITSGADVRLFLMGERLRDSVGAVRLAAKIFRSIPRDYPHSAVAPKALLAAALLAPEDADSLLAVLRTNYADSPYRRAMDGGGDSGLAALEDSVWLKGHERPARPTEVRPRPPARPGVSDPADQRPRPRQPGTSVPPER